METALIGRCDRWTVGGAAPVCRFPPWIWATFPKRVGASPADLRDRPVTVSLRGLLADRSSDAVFLGVVR